MRINLGTYNICHGEGMDHVIDINRQGSFLKEYDLDIVFLQEVDSYTSRAPYNEVEELSKKLNINNFYFGDIRHFLDGEFGNGIISKYELFDSRCVLTDVADGHELRGIVCSKIKINERIINLITVHLPVYEEDRVKYIYKLIEIVESIKDELIIVGGDFNNGIVKIGDHKYIYEEKDKYFEYELLKKYLVKLDNKDLSWFSETGKACIDTFFYSKEFKLLDFKTVNSDSSDHSLVYISLEL